jgi:hypothetical protein
MALCMIDWDSLYPNVLLQSAAYEDSYHCPLLLGLKDIKPRRRRFHFEAFWPKIDGFLEAVHQAWVFFQPNNCPFLTLDNRFRATARGLQAWSDKKAGHVESKLTLAREILCQLEIAQDLRLLTYLEV